MEFRTQKTYARIAGISFLLTLIIGIATTLTVAKGIDINTSADMAATSQAMMDAGVRLKAKAHIGTLGFLLNGVFLCGLYLILKPKSPLLSLWSFITGLMASLLTLLGAVYAMNAYHLSRTGFYTDTLSGADVQTLTALQATSDYTAFHIGLVISSLSMAGFFLAFYSSRLIPRLIAGWGLFASLFVAFVIVLRDFIPALGATPVTLAFMVSNLTALLALALYLTLRGVKQ